MTILQPRSSGILRIYGRDADYLSSPHAKEGGFAGVQPEDVDVDIVVDIDCNDSSKRFLPPLEKRMEVYGGFLK